MSQVNEVKTHEESIDRLVKSNEEFIALYKTLIDQINALPSTDEESRSQMIHHCEAGIELLRRQQNAVSHPPRVPLNDSRPDEFHHQRCQCVHCVPLTGCDR